MISKSIYKKCSKCDKTFDAYSRWGLKLYCSRSCANSRGPRSEEFKQRMKDLYGGKPRDLGYLTKYHQTIEKRAPRPKCKVCGKKCKGLAFVTCSRECLKKLRCKITYCIICGKPKKKHNNKTCSRQCFKKLATSNALVQIKHGGGLKGTYKGIVCDSTYELAFLIWHIDHNIPISRSSNVYSYTYRGKVSKYIPDFIVNNVEYEIKGYMCERAKAKLEQNQHIKVVDKISIQPYIKWVKEKYNVKNIKDLYE